MGNVCRFSEVNDLVIESSEKAQSDEEINYLKNEFEEIKEFRKKIIKMNVFKRKQIAEEEYKKFIKSHNIINDISKNKDKIKFYYIKIVCLTLIDNTNKDIIKLYLNFIKKYHEFVKDNKLLTYEKELNKYKIIFDEDEIVQLDKNINYNNQKKIFMDYLNELVSINSKDDKKLSEFLKETKNKFDNLFLFNTPIESNNKELVYYKLYYNILMEISCLNENIKDEIENKQKVIDYIIKQDLYNNLSIILNEDKMNLLNLFLLTENFDENLGEDGLTNFNRLLQSVPVTRKDFFEFNKGNNSNKLKKNKKKDFIVHILYYSYQIKEGKVSIEIPLEKVCLKNLNNPKLNKEIKEKMFYNLDALLVENELTPHIKNIKKFLIKIVDTKVYKQAIKKLFPKYYNYFDENNNEDIKQFIKERLKFYPFQNLFLSGVTDKLSCYSYIPSINFISKYELYQENENTYKVGLTTVNSLHEINHANQCIIYFKGNNNDLINSPQRKLKDLEDFKKNEEMENKNEKDIIYKEGGNCFEMILFGRIIKNINLFECLYILNEENYKQDLKEFKENFMNIKEIVKSSKGETKFIKIENGIFKEFYEKSIKEIKSIIKLLKKPSGRPPIMCIGKFNKDSNDNDDDDKDLDTPIRKCCLIGGWKKFH